MTPITLLAFLAALIAAVAWGVAARRQWDSGGWSRLCLIVMLFCLWFAGIYAGVLLGLLQSQAVGQLYLRPATTGLLLVSAGVALRFWKRGA